MKSLIVLLVCIVGCNAAAFESPQDEFDYLTSLTFKSRVQRKDFDTITEYLERMAALLAQGVKPKSVTDKDISDHVHLLLNTCVKKKDYKCEDDEEVRKTLEEARQIEFMPTFGGLALYRKNCVTQLTNKCATGLSKCLTNDINQESLKNLETILESFNEAKRKDIRLRMNPAKVETSAIAIAMKKLAPLEIKNLAHKSFGRSSKYKKLFEDLVVKACEAALASEVTKYASLYDPTNGSDALYKNPSVANRRVIARHCESIMQKPEIVAEESWAKLKADGLME